MFGLQARLFVLGLVVLALIGAAVAYVFAPDLRSPDVSNWLAVHRYAWYAPPLVVVAFVVLSALPVMLLVSLTGIAFGPSDVRAHGSLAGPRSCGRVTTAGA